MCFRVKIFSSRWLAIWSIKYSHIWLCNLHHIESPWLGPYDIRFSWSVPEGGRVSYLRAINAFLLRVRGRSVLIRLDWFSRHNGNGTWSGRSYEDSSPILWLTAKFDYKRSITGYYISYLVRPTSDKFCAILCTEY